MPARGDGIEGSVPAASFAHLHHFLRSVRSHGGVARPELEEEAREGVREALPLLVRSRKLQQQSRPLHVVDQRTARRERLDCCVEKTRVSEVDEAARRLVAGGHGDVGSKKGRPWGARFAATRDEIHTHRNASAHNLSRSFLSRRYCAPAKCQRRVAKNKRAVHGSAGLHDELKVRRPLVTRRGCKSRYHGLDLQEPRKLGVSPRPRRWPLASGGILFLFSPKSILPYSLSLYTRRT